MRCVSYMRRDSYWIDERCDYHKPNRHRKGDYDYYDFDGDLIAQQREHIRDYADKLGWIVEEEYIDIEGLDAFERLKRDCIYRKFDCVITDSFYRFSGDIGEAKVTMQHVLIPAGIHVAIAQDKFCSALSTKKGIEFYFKNRQMRYTKEGEWIERKYTRDEDEAEKSEEAQHGPYIRHPVPRRNNTVIGSRAHDDETGEALRFSGSLGTGVLYRNSDAELIKWEVPCPTVLYSSIIEVVKETMRREKAAAELAKENIFSEIAEKKKASLIAPLREKAQQLLEETDVLLARKMKREVSSCKTEAASEDESNVEMYCKNESCDDKSREEENLARIDEEFSEIMEKVKLIETAYSLSNRWISLFSGIDIPMNLTNRHVKLFISDIRICGFGKGEGYSAKVIVRYDDFRSLLPKEWLRDLTFSLSGSTVTDSTENM